MENINLVAVDLGEIVKLQSKSKVKTNLMNNNNKMKDKLSKHKVTLALEVEVHGKIILGLGLEQEEVVDGEIDKIINHKEVVVDSSLIKDFNRTKIKKKTKRKNLKVLGEIDIKQLKII